MIFLLFLLEAVIVYKPETLYLKVYKPETLYLKVQERVWQQFLTVLINSSCN